MACMCRAFRVLFAVESESREVTGTQFTSPPIHAFDSRLEHYLSEEALIHYVHIAHRRAFWQALRQLKEQHDL